MSMPVGPKKPSITRMKMRKHRPTDPSEKKVQKIFGKFHTQIEQQQTSFRPRRHRISKK